MEPTSGSYRMGAPMAADEPGYLGMIQYVGPSVDSGFLDAKKSAQALLGLDEALRYFVSLQSAELAGVEYEIPVRVQSGSWQAMIPQNIEQWIRAIAGLGVSTYVVTAAGQMAKNDFRDVELRQVFVRAFQGIQWTIRIGKHVGTVSKRTFQNVRWQDGSSEVGLPNGDGNLLFVPPDFLNFYEQVPPSVLAKLASIVTEERRLDVVVHHDGRDEIESVEFEDRQVFCPEEFSELFPELEHGASFDCEGLVTRGNENANTVGFLYKDHILTCHPKEGSIVRFKDALFLKSRMVGTVSRADKFGQPTEPRPRIIFSDVTPIEADLPAGGQQPLFLDDETSS